MSSRFYIRNKHSPARNFLAPIVPKNEIERATCFPTKEEAHLAACVHEWGWREVVEISFVLAFFARNGERAHYNPYLGNRGHVATLKDAKRFATAADARKAYPASAFSHSGGPDDKCGWRVMRITKVIRP